MFPLQIRYIGVPKTDAIEATVRESAQKLVRLRERFVHCRVTLDVPHRHHHKGPLYQVRIDLRLAGAELVARSAPEEDLYAAIREAFHVARREIVRFCDQREMRSYG
jgi:ribosome-associated translation inhibitor RaiA